MSVWTIAKKKPVGTITATPKAYLELLVLTALVTTDLYATDCEDFMEGELGRLSFLCTGNCVRVLIDDGIEVAG